MERGRVMGGFRRFIIKTAEIMMLVFVIGLTLGLAIAGAVGGQDQGSAVAILGFIIGGIVGFILASVLAAFFFLLAEIAANTRQEVLQQQHPQQ
jgi:uncharacterized protein YacL